MEGLRAVAVVSVIAHHFSKELLPGGYLGVDVFFVISGYVIDLSLAKRSATSFSQLLLDFFARRAKRLLPALALCVLVGSILICLVNPDPHASLRTGIASLFGLSNLYLFRLAMDYFSPSAEVNVFTHTWSLGVEEQFYLLFPFLIWFSGVGRVALGRRRLIWLMGGAAILSYMLFVWLARAHPVAGYFLMPARFWELAVGCLLYFIMQIRMFADVAARFASLSTVLFASLIALMFIPQDFFVLAVTGAVILTALLIATLRQGAGAYCLMAHPWAIYLGSISYSLYLWHWVVLSLSRWTIGVSWWTAPFQVVAMLAFAAASYKFLENPIRHAPWLRRSGPTILAGLVAAIVVAGMCLVISIFSARLLLLDPERVKVPPAFFPLKVSGLPFNPTCVVDRKRHAGPDIFELCTQPPVTPAKQSIWVLGDSHAGHLQGLLYTLHEKFGVGIHLVETPGVAFPFVRGQDFMPRQLLFERVLQNLRENDVVVVSRLFINRNNFQPVGDLEVWIDDVRALAQMLSKRNVSLVVVGPPPIFEFKDVNICFSLLWGESSCKISRNRLEASIGTVYVALQQRAAVQSNLHIFNSFDVLCPAAGRSCSPFFNGGLLFRDKDHLNTAGAVFLTEPFVGFLRDKRLLQDDLESGGVDVQQ
ncbi:acyltransferase family protein [Aquipseudomonas alcaligenes]|uniref:acyltransferase family protein n=1 Tax=Aquipseudomonas alcaligenes TaxID=43263 RepID=UPI0009F8A2BD|nr:acyltransferase family protein [Pseudomonas alcaligenes]